MLRLVLLCLCATASTWAQETSSNSDTPNTRLFGLGGIASAFNNIVGGGNRPGQFGGNQFGGNRPGQFGGNQFGNNPFGGRPIGGGSIGFGGGGFNNGFGGGVNPGLGGGFGGGLGGGASASCRRWCRTPQGQAYCCESANEPISAAVLKPGQCPPVR